jgi:RNA polymerase sigma-70 factor (ECF subfamily)
VNGQAQPLATRLLARAVGDHGLAAVAREALEARLLELLAAGRAAWPGITLTDDDFLDHLADRLDGGGQGLELLAAVRGDELYLACACARAMPRALAAFERRYLGLARVYLARFGVGSVEDLLQEVRAKLFVGGPERAPRIAEYSGRGSLEGWLRVVAVRIAVDAAEKGKRLRAMTNDDELDEGSLLGAADPELGYIKSHHKQDFEAAFRDAMSTLAAEERTLLRLYLIDKLNIAEIGALLGVHRATVARRIEHCRQRMLETTRARLRSRLGCTDSELESMIGLLHSQLDVSLHAYLRTPA